MWKEKSNSNLNQTYGCKLVIARGGAWKAREVDEGSQKAVTSSYKAVERWECNIQHGDCSYHINNPVLNIWKLPKE